jgi:hypothetical protein
LQPKQSILQRIWNDPSITRIGSGGARGGAKSGGGRRIMLLRRFEYPCTPGLLLRRTLRKLHESHIVKLFEEYPRLRPLYREQKKELLFPNGSRLVFGSAEHEADLANFYSAEYADILVDEAQEFSQGELEELSGSCRCTSNPDITPKMVMSFMPGASDSGLPPKGLPYLKRVFIDRDLQGDEKRLNWNFVQAFSWDNIEWVRKELTRDKVGQGAHRPGDDSCTCQDCIFYSWSEEQRRDYFIERTEYGGSLAALTNKYLRDAWLYGKWGSFQGQFYPNFSYDEHTISPEDLRIEPWHKRWISCDWGDDHPMDVQFHTQDENGLVTTYHEIWGREIGEAQIGKMISDYEAQERAKGRQPLQAFFLSWDAFGKLNKQTRKPITEMIGNALSSQVPKPQPQDASPGTRISGWRLIDQLLDAHKWRCTRDCEQLIKCLPTLVRDMERNSEDVLKVDYSENYIGDDPADNLRYGLQNMLQAPRLPAVKVAEKRVEEYATMKGKNVDDLDINTAAQLHRRALAQVQKQRKNRGGRGKVYRPGRVI